MKGEIDRAMRAHTNLSVFAVVVTVLEDHLYGGSPQAEAASKKIIKIAKQAQQEQLRLMDAATAKIEKGQP